MNLAETIRKDFISAFKSKDENTLRTLKMLQSDIHNAEISKRPSALTEDDILAILKRAAKKRRQAGEIYEKAKRADLATKERQELEVIEQYLPTVQ